MTLVAISSVNLQAFESGTYICESTEQYPAQNAFVLMSDGKAKVLTLLNTSFRLDSESDNDPFLSQMLTENITENFGLWLDYGKQSLIKVKQQNKVKEYKLQKEGNSYILPAGFAGNIKCKKGTEEEFYDIVKQRKKARIKKQNSPEYKKQ